MTIKTPIRTVFDCSGNATGLAEFQTGEAVGYSHGGTGLTCLGSTGQYLRVNSGATGLEWADSSFATESYVDTAVSNLIDTAPTTLDTLNELAAALNDDANFATTVNTSIATKLAITDFGTYFDNNLANKDTDDLSEGSTNQYYTDARVATYLSNNSYATQSYVQSQIETKDNTDEITEGSNNLYYTDARVGSYLTSNSYATQSYVQSQIETKDNTDEITEGTTNLYYTDARARCAVSASGDLSYNSSSGQFSVTTYKSSDFITDFNCRSTDNLSEGSNNLYYTQTRVNSAFDTRLATKTTADLTECNNLYYTDARAQGAISVTDAGGDGSLTYSSGTITYTGPSASETRAHFSGGTGVTITNGAIAIGQAVGTSDNVTFNNVTVNGTLSSDDLTAATVTTSGNVVVQGNLTVNGTTTTVNSNTVNIGDAILTLNSDETGAPSANAGIEIERGTSTNVSFLWDEATDKWTVGTGTIVASTFEGNVTGNITGDVTGTVSSLSNHDTDDVAEGATNQYFTIARARSSISASGDLSYNSSTGVLSFTERTDAEVQGLISVTDAGGYGSLSKSGGTITYTGPTTEEMQDLIGAMVSSNSESGIAVTYDDTNGKLNFNVGDPTITLTGAVTGSATMTNLGNVSITTTATADPTLTINGDASGSATFTNLGNATLTLTIADDSHNHTIANIDNLQSSLNAKANLSGATFTGTVTAPDFNTTSDVNLKTNIQTIESPRDKVNSLRGTNFNWKNSGDYTMGVIAQEVEEVIPEVVATDVNGKKSVNYQAMVGLLIEAIKDLQDQVDDLKNNR